MDLRKSLKQNTVLKFANSYKTYKIRGEIGRGGLSIVYDAFYINNAGESKTVRIKECYPFKISCTREESGNLILNDNEKIAFDEYKSRFMSSFCECNELFEKSGLTNCTSNMLDIYDANNTLYIVSTYNEGAVLSYDTFDSLKQVISVVRSIAEAVKKLHNHGFLYLDLKPDNIFVFNEITEIIQLFDFDSILPLDRSRRTENYKISYSKGFAALEQQMGKNMSIGKHTDVFGVGALLFYLLFGYAPSALECDIESDYLYSKSKYAKYSYRDVLYQTMTDFLHHTISSYYPDRYPDMEIVIEKLSEIERYADITVPYVLNSFIPEHSKLLGRDNELESLHQWFADDTQRCIFITGMGGIGKSSLVREYLCKNRDDFDYILFLNYNSSIVNTITNDQYLYINTIEKAVEETMSEYFVRKTGALRRLLEGTKAVLVIDNYDGEPDKDFLNVSGIDWKVIIITRNEINARGNKVINIQAIKELEFLCRIFEINLGRDIEEEELPYIYKIINKVWGHTFAIELIAKQVAKSYLTVAEAFSMAEEFGFLNIAPEKVKYEKDGQMYHEKLSAIITALFETGKVSSQKKLILKTLALFNDSGVDIRLYVEMLDLDTKDNVNELIEEGWIILEEQKLSLHPVIRETVLQWNSGEEYRKAVEKILNFVFKYIELEGKRKENPDKIQKKNEREFNIYLNLSECILESCKSEKEVCESGVYMNLLYETIINLPRDREEFILKYANKLLENPSDKRAEALIKIYDYVVFLYAEKGDFKRAYEILLNAKCFAKKYHSNYIWGIYYEMQGNYYEALLNGAYDYCDEDQEEFYMWLMDSVKISIRYMRKSRNQDSNILLAKYVLAKAVLLIRNSRRRKKEIDKLLTQAKKLTEKHVSDHSQVKETLELTYAWYHTLVDKNYDKTVAHLQQAFEISQNNSANGIDKIDYNIVPCADMLFQWEKYEESIKWLDAGIQECERHIESIPYIRKKMELYMHKLDVYFELLDKEKCQEIIKIIDDGNKSYLHMGIAQEISDEIRGFAYTE